MFYDYDKDKSLNEILVYIEVGRYKEALERLRELLSQSPNDGKLLYLASCCYYYLGVYEEAIEYCHESLENQFSAEACHYLLGRIYMLVEQFVKSEEHFLESLGVNPVNPTALASYGILMLKTGHEKKATKLMDEAMRLDPENEVVLNSKFIYYIFKGNENAQINVLETYLNSASSEVRKLLNLGLYHMHYKRYSDARENFRQAFLLNPTDNNILSILEELDKASHWVFIPNRLIDKLGGPAVVWVTFFSMMILTRYLLSPIYFALISSVYFIFAISTWISPLLYKAIIKFK